MHRINALPNPFFRVVGHFDLALSTRQAFAAVCGTTPFPKSLIRSTLSAHPLTTRPNPGSGGQGMFFFPPLG